MRSMFPEHNYHKEVVPSPSIHTYRLGENSEKRTGVPWQPWLSAKAKAGEKRPVLTSNEA